MSGQIDRHVIDPAPDAAKRDFRFELQLRHFGTLTHSTPRHKNDRRSDGQEYQSSTHG
jgi:hypothetical protein